MCDDLKLNMAKYWHITGLLRSTKNGEPVPPDLDKCRLNIKYHSISFWYNLEKHCFFEEFDFIHQHSFFHA